MHHVRLKKQSPRAAIFLLIAHSEGIQMTVLDLSFVRSVQQAGTSPTPDADAECNTISTLLMLISYIYKHHHFRHMFHQQEGSCKQQLYF